MDKVPSISYLQGDITVRLVDQLVERDPLAGQLTVERVRALEDRLRSEIKQAVARVFDAEEKADDYDVLPFFNLTSVESHWYDEDGVTELQRQTRSLNDHTIGPKPGDTIRF